MNSKRISERKRFAIDTVRLILEKAGITESEYMDLTGTISNIKDELWTEKDVVRYLKISKPSFYNLVRAGKIKRISFGEHCKRYRREDILLLCEEHLEHKPLA